MLIEFLKHLEEISVSKVLSMQEDLDLSNSRLNEEEKFLSLIEKEHNDDFNDFSPRRFESVNDQKLKQTRDDISSLKEHIVSVTESLKEEEMNLSEIRSSISEANGYLNSIKNDQLSKARVSVVSKLDLISSLLKSDPVRAKIEIDELKKTLSS